MADLFIPQWVPSNVNAEFTHKASEAANIGDLAYWDSASIMRSALNFTDAGNALLTQQQFSRLYGGVFNSKQLSTDATARNARLVIDHIYEYPCASSTFAIGDYVAPTYTAGVLSNQSVSKVTDPSAAIGRVVKAYASATTLVKCRLMSSLLLGKMIAQSAVAAEWKQVQGAAPSAGSFTIFLANRPYRLNAISCVFGTASTSGTATVNKETGTTAAGSGTALLSSTMSLAGTANTVVQGTLITTAATILLATGDRLSVTLGGTLTNLANAVVFVDLTPI